MDNELELFHKNKDLIEITTNQITKQQLKAFNYIAYEARKQLKKNNEQMMFYFDYSEIIKGCGIGNTNHKHLYDMLNKLSMIGVELYKDARNWAVFCLISEAKRMNERLRITLAPTMCDCLLEKNYTTLDLKVIRNFNSKYTIMFYEMYQKYKAINFPILDISDFKKLCGIEAKKTYQNFYNVTRDILKPALQELAEKEKIYLDYRLKKRGKAYATIQFYLTSAASKQDNNKMMLTDEEYTKQLEEFKKSEEYQKLMNNKDDFQLEEPPIKITKKELEEFQKDLKKDTKK